MIQEHAGLVAGVIDVLLHYEVAAQFYVWRPRYRVSLPRPEARFAVAHDV